MKHILVIFVGFLFSMNTTAQESQPDKSKPKTETEITVTADTFDFEPPQTTVDYPECKPKLPNVTLQRALKIAEKYIRTEKINATNHYLARVFLRCDETGEKVLWQFTWRSEHKPNVEIDVTMKGKARLIQSRIESIM